MDDILFGNNNQATINRLAKRSYRANKQRNVFVTIALKQALLSAYAMPQK